VTGRSSSAKPNLQNVPRESEIRSCIGSPPGWKLVEGDYSQVELRMAAHMAQEPTMIRIYRENGDIHTKTACITTGKSPEEVTKEERKKAKAVNFGFLYGMGWRKFIEYAKASYGIDFTEEEAKNIRAAFFATYSALPPWHDRQRRIVKELGFVRSPLGRKRRLPEVYSTDDFARSEAERQAINSPVQAVPPDLTHLAVMQLSKMDGFWEECYLVAQVHDALLFEIREDVVDKWVPLIKGAMENMALVKKIFGIEFLVPIVADVTVGEAWGKGEEWKPSENHTKRKTKK
jgi:DNA polymerase-1